MRNTSSSPGRNSMDDMANAVRNQACRLCRQRITDSNDSASFKCALTNGLEAGSSGLLQQLCQTARIDQVGVGRVDNAVTACSAHLPVTVSHLNLRHTKQKHITTRCCSLSKVTALLPPPPHPRCKYTHLNHASNLRGAEDCDLNRIIHHVLHGNCVEAADFGPVITI